MKITIELDTLTDDADELAAIFNALAGRDVTYDFDKGEDMPPPPASESAIAAEAARVTNDVPPPPPAPVVQLPDGNVAVNSAAGPLDSKGTPWDARIHADSKGQNADGQYKRRKGVDAATYDRIGAELRAALGNPTPAASPAAPPPPPAPVPTASDTVAATTAPDAPPPPPPAAVAADAIPPAPEAAGGMTVQEALALATTRGMTFEQNGALCTAIGLGGVHELLTAPPEKVQAFVDMLRLTHGPDPV